MTGRTAHIRPGALSGADATGKGTYVFRTRAVGGEPELAIEHHSRRTNSHRSRACPRSQTFGNPFCLRIDGV